MLDKTKHKLNKNHRLKLKHRLELRGYSLTDVAELAGVTKQAVSFYVRGDTLESDIIETTINKILAARKAA